MLVVAGLSSMAIVILDSIGTSKLASMLMSNSTTARETASTMGPRLVRTALGWLLALGVIYMLLVAAVASTIRTTTVSKRNDKLVSKLAVFFIGTALLEIGQGFRLGGGAATTSRPVFYITGFALEVLVVALYAAADVDHMFHDSHVVDPTLSRYTTRTPRFARPLRFFPRSEDEHDIPPPRRAQKKPAAEWAPKARIMIRQSLNMYTARPENTLLSQTRSNRPSSAASASSNISATSGRTSRISEINFPLVDTDSAAGPTPVHIALTRHGAPHVSAEPHIGLVKEQFSSRTSSMSGRAKSSPYAPSSSYDPFTKPQRAGLRQLELQLEDYDIDMELSDAGKVLHRNGC